MRKIKLILLLLNLFLVFSTCIVYAHSNELNVDYDICGVIDHDYDNDNEIWY